MSIRQPIVCVLGHVDTGKTSLLDNIRKTTVQLREAGGITQHIGASFFPIETLKQLIGTGLAGVKAQVQIPGLLVVDTPGHEVFTNLRRRGGSVADIAILVIDVLRGFEAQTYECIEILKARKTPFLVAVNKIDRLSGWTSHSDNALLKNYAAQDRYVREDLDNRIYEIIGVFSRLNLNTDRFDRIRDFTKTVALVPTSAVTGEGIPELLMVLVGLAQQHLKKRLTISMGPAKGTVLEVKEDVGLGTTINAIIYDGVLRRDDLIVVGGKEKPIVTRIRAMLVPKALDEIRDPREKFSSVDSISAAAGIKIVAPELQQVLAGAPLYAVAKDDEAPDRYVTLVSEEIDRIRVTTEIHGVVVKADALGSLEAMVDLLRKDSVPVRIADVGDVSKRDVVEASIVKEHSPAYGAILTFGVKVLPDAQEEASSRGVEIFGEKIIYRVIENYLEWNRKKSEAETLKTFESLVTPAKIQVMPGCVFRRAKPAIFGIEVLAGRIKPKVPLINASGGEELGEIQQIQDKGKSISEASFGMQVAVSMDKPTIGRHVVEGDTLLVKVPERDAKALLVKFFDRLSDAEQQTLNEYAALMRKKVPFWAA